MTIRLRALELHVMTGAGPVGLRLEFNAGLTVLRAPNNSGKSTMLQAVIYALGLEGMFSASRDVPLPHAMTDRVEVGGEELAVVQSHVALEVENGVGDIRTFQRAVGDSVLDRHVIAVWDGPRITTQGQVTTRSDYFVRRAGAARRELGFHHYLAEFVGWQLPEVQHYDGSESPLYMEALFPLIFVEQKQGWGGTRPRMPTYLGIRDVGRRAVEFILSLSTLERTRRRGELEQSLRETATEWTTERARLDVAASREGGQLVGVPVAPTTWTPAIEPRIIFSTARGTAELVERLQQVDAELASSPSEPPVVADAAPELTGELNERQTELREAVARAAALEEALSLAANEVSAVERRIDATEEDKLRLADVRLLRSLGSPLGLSAIADHDCPTCHQPLDRIEVEEDEIPLSIDDNLRLLDERLVTLRSMRHAAESSTRALSVALTGAREISGSLRLRIRSLKSTLTQPERMPSVAAIERRVSLERKRDELAELADALAVSSERLRLLAQRSDELRAALGGVSGEFSDEDLRKISSLQESVRSQLSDYGFGSLPSEEVTVSPETLNPTHEGFDLSFDISASDTVRTKWAYFLGLAQVAVTDETNHPRMIIFDEPGQQEIDPASLVALIHRAGATARAGFQVILATSEAEEVVRGALEGLEGPIELRVMPGKLLQPLN